MGTIMGVQAETVIRVSLITGTVIGFIIGYLLGRLK